MGTRTEIQGYSLKGLATMVADLDDESLAHFLYSLADELYINNESNGHSYNIGDLMDNMTRRLVNVVRTRKENKGE